MAAVPKLDVNIARKFRPFDSQSITKVREIVEKSAVQKLPADRVLFKQGDKDKWTIYLLSGKIELTNDNGDEQIIEGDTESAIDPISNQEPRLNTAKSLTDISILIIDRGLLQLILEHDDGGSVVVGGIDEDEDEDWMTRFLQSNAFLQLPPSNIQSLMMSLKEIPLKTGETVIKENSPNDDKFYIIQEGSCIVTKTNQNTGKEITLAQLKYGTGFGEEALITGGVRGASVSMQTDGVILTLEKDEFLDLLVAPLINRIKPDELKVLIPSADNQLIDVRNEDEFAKGHLENTSKNIPINLIRSQLGDLDEEKHYIVYSSAENRSSAAAFLFIQQGFDCSILADGIGEEEVITPDVINESAAGEAPSTSKEQEPAVETTIEIDETPEATATEAVQSGELTLEERCKKAETLAATFKSKAQEAIKFAKIKAKQLEILKQKLAAETQRADKAEAELKKLRQ